MLCLQKYHKLLAISLLLAMIGVSFPVLANTNDEALIKYKETLLASADPAAAPADDPRRVIVQKMVIATEGREDIEFDLANNSQKPALTMKEGTEFKIKLFFKVHHEIVSGLRYHHVMSGKGITVDKKSYMIGSYPPKQESHEYITPSDETPKGMMARGHYKVKSKVIDDDKNVHLSWEWAIDVKKDWQ